MLTLEGDTILVPELEQYSGRTLRALVRAINRALVAGRTFLARSMASDTGIKVGDIRKALSERQATFQRIEARLGASLKRLPLSKYGARGPLPSRGAEGTAVSWRVGSSKQSSSELFMAKLASGHVGVFARVGGERRSRGGWSQNLPVLERFGPSLGHVMGKYHAQALQIADEAFTKNFDREMDYQNRQGGTVTVTETIGGEA